MQITNFVHIGRYLAITYNVSKISVGIYSDYRCKVGQFHFQFDINGLVFSIYHDFVYCQFKCEIHSRALMSLFEEYIHKNLSAILQTPKRYILA